LDLGADQDLLGTGSLGDRPDVVGEALLDLVEDQGALDLIDREDVRPDVRSLEQGEDVVDSRLNLSAALPISLGAEMFDVPRRVSASGR
jgi:hypothetical protein